MTEQSNEIGSCEVCGLVDHHLVDGACNACNSKHNLVTGEHACNDNYVLDVSRSIDAALKQAAFSETLNVEVTA